MKVIGDRADMTRSLLPGFHDNQPALPSSLELFARLKGDRIIPG